VTLIIFYLLGIFHAATFEFHKQNYWQICVQTLSSFNLW